ncbi:MAG TPA: NfeD family protein [Candidatus Binatia bacterium]
MPTWLRYVLLQLPGALLAAVVLLLFWDETGLPGWIGVVVFVLWVAKDAVLYPFLRRAYEPPSPSGGERLVGRRGVAREELRPYGQVQVNGELWRARAADGSGKPIPAGAEVVVRGAERLTLIVERAPS